MLKILNRNFWNLVVFVVVVGTIIGLLNGAGKALRYFWNLFD